MKRKLISIFLSLFTILMAVPTFAFNTSAADYATELRNKGFPVSYIYGLTELHKLHPNWNFVPLNVNESFAAAVASERKSHSQQLIQKYSGNDGKGLYCTCSKCLKNGSYVIQEGGGWVSASEQAVEYYMDPRNFLDEQHIFQFESTLYTATQTQDGVESILKGTWMYKSNITYKDSSGKTITYSPTTKYSTAIMSAAKASGLSPYYLASKIVQEVGGAKATAGGASGTYSGYKGIYNYYNIAAYTGAADGLKWASYTPSGAHVQTSKGGPVNLRKSPVSGGIVASIPSGTAVKTYSFTSKQSDGYQWVKITNVSVGGKTYTGYIRSDYFIKSATDTYSRPWTNPYKTIYYGAKWIANNFGNQYTGYLQKFNVNPASNSMHSHEYMANVQAASTEAVKTYNAYKNAGALNESITFSIPVFTKMPNDIPTSKLSTPIVKATVNSDCSFTLSWDDISGADKYEVYIRNADGTTYRLLKTVTTNSTKIANAAYGKTYAYKVRAIYSKNSAYASNYSPVVTAVNNKKLMAPVLKTATNSDFSFKISWNAVAGANSYEIYGSNSQNTAYRKLATVSGTSYTTGSAAIGVTYNYKAKAINTKNSAITSDYSAVASTALSIKFTAPVLNDIKVNNDCSFTLSWNEISGADKYEIYLKKTDGSFRLLKTVSENTATISGAAYGKEYTYKIKAINSKNTALNSEFSNTKSAINNKKLQTPLLSNIKVNTDGSFTLSWAEITGADKYQIYKKETDGTFKLYKTVTGSSATISNTIYGATYTFKMKAVNSQNSTAASEFSNTVSDVNNKKLQTPANLKLTENSNGSFTITWGAVTGADKYEVYILDSTTNKYRLSGTVTKTTATTAAAPYGKSFSYKVRALNSKNSTATSEFSAAITGTNKSKLTTPIVKLAVNTDSSFTLTWNTVTGADKYEICLKNADGTYRLLRTCSTNSIKIGNAAYGKKYTYKVRALSSKNVEITSNYSAEITGINNKLKTPTNVKLTVNSNCSFTLTWDKVTNASKYEIYLRNANGTYRLLRTVTTNKTTINNAAYNKKYTYKIKAISGTAASDYSNVISGTNNKKLLTPSNVKLVVNSNASFTVSWNAVAGADKYEIYIKNADGSYRLLKTVSAKKVIIKNAKKGKKYTYKIRAINSKNKNISSAYAECSGTYK